VPAALSGGPSVLLQQLPGSADLQLVVRSQVIHPHLKGQAVDGFRPGGHAEGLVAQAQLTEGLPSLPVEGGAPVRGRPESTKYIGSALQLLGSQWRRAVLAVLGSWIQACFSMAP